jgi:phenylpropionate dioxygenase-like ring-hydroxylating dioxygenase large terminal subunit
MLTTMHKSLRKFWYPVLRESHLDQGLVPFTLLGENIVLWREADGSVACIRDRCCHRTAKLSKGFLHDGRVACGYHGWEYDRTGRCVKIPQQPEPEKVPAELKVPSYRAEIRYGHVWVALDEPLSPLPDFPEENEGLRRIDQFYEEWQIAALRLMENSFDAAHIAFTHRKSFGNSDQPMPAKSELVPFDYGFHVYAENKVMNRDAVSQKYLGGVNSEETVRKNHSTWFMPFVRRLGITYPHGLRHTIITAATPMTDNRSMVVQFCYRSDSEAEAKAADIIAFDRQVTLEDKEILESTEYDVPLDNKDLAEFHMASDTPGLRMRRMLQDLLAEHGEAESRLPS